MISSSGSRANATAAFFASYLEGTYKNTLVKRIMYEILQENSDEFTFGMSLEKFVL